MAAMTSPSLTLQALNTLDPAPLVAALAEVFEHAPWVAEAAIHNRPYPSVAALHDAMMQTVRTAPPDPGRRSRPPRATSSVTCADATVTWTRVSRLPA